MYYLGGFAVCHVLWVTFYVGCILCVVVSACGTLAVLLFDVSCELLSLFDFYCVLSCGRVWNPDCFAVCCVLYATPSVSGIL